MYIPFPQESADTVCSHWSDLQEKCFHLLLHSWRGILWALLLPLFIFYSFLLCCTLLSTLLFFTSCSLPLLPWWLRKWNMNNFTGYTVTCIVPPTMYNNYFPTIAKLYLKLPVTTITVIIIITIIIIINILIYILLLSQLSIQWRWKIMTLTRMRWFIIQC